MRSIEKVRKENIRYGKVKSNDIAAEWKEGEGD